MVDLEALATALKEGQRQQAIMDKVMATADIETNWESEEVEQLILKQKIYLNCNEIVEFVELLLSFCSGAD